MYKLRVLLIALLATLPVVQISSQEALPTRLPLISDRAAPENPPSIPTFSYESYQATFLKAKAAQISPSDGGVVIEVQELSSELLVGVVLSFDGLTNPIIEATTLLELNGVTVGTFPPQLIKPNTAGKYPIIGKKGDKFGIRVETVNGTTFVTAQIEGEALPPPDPPPPPVDLADVTRLVSASVSVLADSVTQQAIKAELEKLLANFPDDLSLAIASLKSAISTGLLESMPQLSPPYKDWKGGFREPLDKKLVELKPATSSQLKSIVEAVVRGM